MFYSKTTNKLCLEDSTNPPSTIKTSINKNKKKYIIIYFSPCFYPLIFLPPCKIEHE